VNPLVQRLAASIPGFGGWARHLWCRRQRRRLLGMTTKVLWVAPAEVPWALWGAERQFFDADWAGRLLYLRGR
jgi:hypothetical protein